MEIVVTVTKGNADDAAALRELADFVEGSGGAVTVAAAAPKVAAAAPKPAPAASPAKSPQGGTAAATPAKRGPGRPPKNPPPPPPEEETETESGEEGGDDDLGFGLGEGGDEEPAALTLEADVIPAFQEFAKRHGAEGRAKAAQILAKFKVKSVRELKEDQFADVLKLLKK